MVTGPTLQGYHNEHMEKVVQFWYNAKNGHTENKTKRNKYKQRSSTKSKRICFDISVLKVR